MNTALLATAALALALTACSPRDDQAPGSTPGDPSGTTSPQTPGMAATQNNSGSGGSGGATAPGSVTRSGDSTTSGTNSSQGASGDGTPASPPPTSPASAPSR